MPYKIIITATFSALLALIAWSANGFAHASDKIQHLKDDFDVYGATQVQEGMKRALFVEGELPVWNRSRERVEQFLKLGRSWKSGTAHADDIEKFAKRSASEAIGDKGTIDGLGIIDVDIATSIKSELSDFLQKEHAAWHMLSVLLEKKRGKDPSFDEVVATRDVEVLLNDYYRLNHSIAARHEFWKEQLHEVGRQLNEHDRAHSERLSELKSERLAFGVSGILGIVGAGLLAVTSFKRAFVADNKHPKLAEPVSGGVTLPSRTEKVLPSDAEKMVPPKTD